MGARQAYSVINCLIYLPLCFFGIIGLFLRIIAVVSVNPVIVSFISYTFKRSHTISITKVVIYFIDFYWSIYLC